MNNYRHILVVILSLLFFTAALSAQNVQIDGTVKDRQGKPVEFATVTLEGNVQWAVTDRNGDFTVKNIAPGKHTVTVAGLGYVTYSREVTLSKDITNYKVFLDEDNLALEGATVTAKEDANSTTTARTRDLPRGVSQRML